MSFDMFHHKKHTLYKAMNLGNFNGTLQAWDNTPKILAPTLKEEFPEIANFTRYDEEGDFLLTAGDKKLKANVAFVDTAFFEMFDFSLIAGNKQQVLRHPTDIVLTESLAKRFFGEEGALGKTIKIDSTDVFTVSGVLADMPGNSQFREVEYFLPWSYQEKLGWDDKNWGNNSIETYVELVEGVTQTAVESKIRDITMRHLNRNEDIQVFLHALPNWWLHAKFENGKMAGGRIEMVRLFAVIAAFILLIACINFMNLSTARSEKRAKEVGIRKVAGAYRYSLIGQFLSESILIAGIAGILAIGIVFIALPSFNHLVHQRLSIIFNDIGLWLAASGFILFTGLLAGSYPALSLSAFQPVKVLKGTFRKTNAFINPRKLLVIVQFSIAITLIICTVVIHRQIQHGVDRETGYKKNNVIYLQTSGEIDKNYLSIRNELLNSGIATSITKTMSPMTEVWSNGWGVEWKGKPSGDKTSFERFRADEHLVKTVGLTLLEGRDFDLTTYPTDSTAILLNESAVKAMGFEHPIGQTVKDNGVDWHVVGVIKDFIIRSPYAPVRPMLIEGAKGWFGAIHIKFNESISTTKALAEAGRIFNKFNPNYPFEYHFLDDAYAKKFAEYQRLGNLAALFAFLTIFISCLGLFGLAAYMAQNRTKEIGVRKVLGASVFSVTKLLSIEFVVLVVISCFLAFPIAYWAMDRFLQNYDYRISLGWGIFLLSGIGALALALLTVSSQAIKAALANPVDSLRNE